MGNSRPRSLDRILRMELDRPSLQPAAAYNLHVARGWESKSVEAQQAEADQKPTKPHYNLTREEAARQREGENLRLARTRILRQLESTSSPRYRTLLEETLNDLDDKLKRFPNLM